MKHGRLAESVRHHEHGKHLHALAHGHHSHAAALADELGDDLMSAHHASHAKEHGKAMRWHHNQLG
jgi:hypothetical protein